MELRQGHMLTSRKLLSFWSPLAATWLMMAIEGPFLAAIIARLPEPKYNLAAYGVAYAFALIIEAPVIMIMSASTALVRDAGSFFKLRNFIYSLNIFVTSVMLFILIPPVFYFITQDLMGLSDKLSGITYTTVLLLLPWPAAIGYRRFYQGILIRANLTRRVAYGTGIRLVSMSVSAMVLYFYFRIDGALVGASALSLAVTLEAIASRIMANRTVKSILARPATEDQEEPQLTYSGILNFYYPLALTSMLGLGVQPLVTFFLGHSRMALESLAVFPVVNSLVFIFRGIGLSFQEVGVALFGKKNENYLPLRRFALRLGMTLVAVLALIAFTPLSLLWYEQISGLSPDMAKFALLPTSILVMMPGLTVLLSFQRSLLINAKRNTSITIATALEVCTILTVLLVTTRLLNWVGIVAAALALLSGRLLANSYLSLSVAAVRRREDR